MLSVCDALREKLESIKSKPYQIAGYILFVLNQNLPVRCRLKGSETFEKAHETQFYSTLYKVIWTGPKEGEPTKTCKKNGYFEFIFKDSVVSNKNSGSLDTSTNTNISTSTSTSTSTNTITNTITNTSTTKPNVKKQAGHGLTEKKLCKKWREDLKTIGINSSKIISAWKEIKLELQGSSKWVTIDTILPIDVRRLKIDHVYSWLISKLSWLPLERQGTMRKKTQSQVQTQVNMLQPQTDFFTLAQDLMEKHDSSQTKDINYPFTLLNFPTEQEYPFYF